ncbi:hypothetical protein LQ948_17400 [Jiella sp. MQZ9-1]|uniref:Transmembrane protein (PGPGW) n=2 Tax=Jiella flava TaxID=2816857 RepID=A0A939G0Y7_9HYPH|nr:hypothetical protein [Jiella flava]MBO0664351.1 hypothetical protein [Jiella flava]MCD2472987.1 hypothetical protein [Jiella flava]
MFGRDVPLPGSRRWRVALGIALIIGGLLGFLPVLGFWMIPVGLMVLSVDSPAVRRRRRRAEVTLVRWWRTRRARRQNTGVGGAKDAGRS